MPLKPIPIEERFWTFVDKRGPNECWNWTGATVNGYGTIGERVNGKPRNVRATRYSYRTAYGDFDARLLVCHSCDNPRCVNPAHLWLGTHSDNAFDMIRKGRQVLGNRIKTHCRRGHPFTPDNIAPNGGSRTCRICRKASDTRHTAAVRKFCGHAKKEVA